MAESLRRFPPPWRAELIPGGYVVRDANGQALTYLHSRGNATEALQPKMRQGTRRDESPLTSPGCRSYWRRHRLDDASLGKRGWDHEQDDRRRQHHGAVSSGAVRRCLSALRSQDSPAGRRDRRGRHLARRDRSAGLAGLGKPASIVPKDYDSNKLSGPY
jgi:hypothetical protein